MKDKLPKVFANSDTEKIDNNTKVFYSSKDNNEMERNSDNHNSDISVNKKIQQLFSDKAFVYKISATIKLKDGEITKTIIGKNSEYLLTIDNEKIPINDITDIY